MGVIALKIIFSKSIMYVTNFPKNNVKTYFMKKIKIDCKRYIFFICVTHCHKLFFY